MQVLELRNLKTEVLRLRAPISSNLAYVVTPAITVADDQSALSPVSKSHQGTTLMTKCSAKSRASTLIQRYAGSHWQQAQRSKWMIDVVMHIDRDYR
eukprot:419654-Pelagomonas_calceolata.AAC.1